MFQKSRENLSVLFHVWQRALIFFVTQFAWTQSDPFLSHNHHDGRHRLNKSAVPGEDQLLQGRAAHAVSFWGVNLEFVIYV